MINEKTLGQELIAAVKEAINHKGHEEIARPKLDISLSSKKQNREKTCVSVKNAR